MSLRRLRAGGSVPVRVTGHRNRDGAPLGAYCPATTVRRREAIALSQWGCVGVPARGPVFATQLEFYRQAVLFRLPMHVAAKLAALNEMCPALSRTQLVGDLLSATCRRRADTSP